MALTYDALAGARFGPGSARAILLRWALSVTAALPVAVVSFGSLENGPASASVLAHAGDPLPLVNLAQFAIRIPGDAWGVMLIVAMMITWLGGQLLTAGTIDLLCRRSTGEGVRVWRTAVDTGVRFVLPSLRIAALAALWIGAVSTATSFASDWVSRRAELGGASASTLLIALPAAQAFTLLLVWSLVGACATWARVILVSGNRRYVRRLHTIVPRASWRWPVQGFVVPALLASISVVVSATVLFAWRLSGAGATLGWIAAWLLVLLLQAFLWHWRLRICCLLWMDEGMARWGSVPDEPWRFVPRRLVRWSRRRFARREPPDLVAPESTPAT